MAGRRGPLVGSLAEGRRERDHVRAAGHGLRAALAPAGPGRWRRSPAAGGPRQRSRPSGPPTGSGTAARSGTCRRARRPGGSAALRYVPSAGVEAGHWWGELTADQRGADAFSLVFDSPPLEEEVEILGFPMVMLNGGADAEPLHWFGRLCDVAPDGTVTLVTGGGRAGRPDPLRDGGSLPSRRPGAAAAGAARHLVGLPARPPDPARAVQRDVADDLADAVPGHGHGAAGAGRDQAGAAGDPGRPGGRPARAGLRRARSGAAPARGPAPGRDAPGALDPAA